MSEVDAQEEFHDAPEEAVIEVQKDFVAEIEEDNSNAQQNEDGDALVTAEADDEKSAQQLDEDRTEDQVPDITGTEYVDPMTTSMDGIEELPANEEAQFGDTIIEEDEVPDQLESYEYQEPRSDAISSEIIEEEFIEEEESEYVDESAPAADESAPAEDSPKEEENAPAEDAAPAEEEAPAKEEQTAEEPAETEAAPEEAQPADEPAAEEPQAEEAAPEEAAAEEPQAELIEVAVEEAPADEPVAEEAVEPEAEKQEFELQAPPEGKRPRTPNDLDNPPEAEEAQPTEETEVEASVPPTPKTAASGKQSVPPTPRSAAPSEVPPTPKSAAPSEVPPTPKSAAPSEVPPTPKSAAPTSVPPTPKSAAPSEVPPTPKSAAPSEVPPTPKSAVPSEVPSTPKSAAPTSVPPTPRSAAPSSVPPTPKSAAPSEVPPTPKLANGSIPGTPSVAQESAKATPAATPAAQATPKADLAFNFEETPATPKSSVPATPNEATPLSTPAPKTPKTPKTPRTPRTPKTPKTPKTPAVVEQEPEPEPEPEPVAEEPAAEPEPEPVAEEAEPEPAAEEPKEEEQPEPEPEPQAEEESAPPAEPEAVEQPISKTEVATEESAPPARQSSPSPPPARRRVQSPSPERQRSSRHADRDITSYDEDSYRTVPPPRVPTATSFSSWNPPDKQSYTPISPFVSTANKYRNEYTSGSSYRPSNIYTSHFDDIVSTGAFSSALYSTTRLIERSRSRTRERKQALRSQRSASNYYRYVSQYPAPTRAREYSTPPTHVVSRPPSRSSSFVSFLDYTDSKQGELSRANSRSSIYGDSLSRSGSRANVDLYLGGGRLSRVDSYVRDIHTPYEYEVPSTYERYRSSSRGPALSTVNGYTSYTSSPSYVETESTRRMKRYQRDTSPAMVRSMYEGRIGQLERSLSREVIQKDKLRSEYQTLSSKLNQAVRQMELLSPFTPPSMDAQRLTNRPDIRRSIAYSLDLRATGLPTTERWRLGNVVYGGLYRKKYDPDVEKAVQFYSSCAKLRRG